MHALAVVLRENRMLGSGRAIERRAEVDAVEVGRCGRADEARQGGKKVDEAHVRGACAARRDPGPAMISGTRTERS